MPRLRGSTVVATAGSLSGSDSEGFNAEDANEESIFQNYLSVCKDLPDNLERDEVFDRGLSRVKEYLHSSHGSSSICLICLGEIKPSEAIWYCSDGCHEILHMVCIQEWARNQLDAAALKAERRLSPEHFPNAGREARAAADWGCPKCRHPYPGSQIPSQYTCFCGKRVEPTWDPWLAPHTCGETCEKQLPSSCGHTCLLLCHPGPCPPCPLVVDAACFCGKQVYKRRCGHHEFSCKQGCGAKLGCGHTCPDICHEGECPPCGKVGLYQCACGQEQRKLPCHQRNYHCSRVCGKPLACGRHTCEEVCHSGPCKQCPFQETRTCPCGKQQYPGLACTEKPATCGETCGKLLACGLHACMDRCHYGECSKTCRAVDVKACRCGKISKEMPCYQELLCERRCSTLRPCSRHRCGRRCCDGNCPPCEEVCNRKLRCGNHKCPAPCHSGPCRPCPLSVRVSCACGATQVSLPCGAEQQAKPPKCPNACPITPLCRHAASLPPHRCHYGLCPGCSQPCGSPLPCGHTCGSTMCHDPPPPPVEQFVKPKPPVAGTPQSTSAGSVANGHASISGVNRGPAGSTARDALPAAAAAAAAAAVAPHLAPGPAAMPSDSPAARAAQQAAQAKVSLAGLLPSECPPCMVPVTVKCLGGHTEQVMPCSTTHPFSCKGPCNQPLACGNHMCQRPCHAVKPKAGAVSTPLPSSTGTSTGSSSSGTDSGSSSSASQECEVCDRICERQQPCGHPCSLACHRGPCAPCQLLLRSPCYCGKASIKLECQQLTRAKAMQAQNSHGMALLCCGKPCHRQLPHCPHICQAVCHTGACPAADSCSEEVTVRCSCKQLKAKWSCKQVRQALAKDGKKCTYDSGTAPRLLQCTEECEKARQQVAGSKAAKGSAATSDQAASDAARSSPGAAAAAPAAGAVQAAAGQQTKQSRQQARTERELRAQQREKEKQRQQLMKRLKILAVWAVIVVLGLVLGLLGPEILFWVDNKAQQQWKPANV